MGRATHSRREKMELVKKTIFLVILLAMVPTVAALASHYADRQASAAVTKGALSEEAPAPAEQEPIDLVEIGGETYIPKKSVETYLFVGVDSKDGGNSLEDGTGQCDVLELLVFDRRNNSYTLLPINRDTVTDVRSLDENGTYLATSQTQISLAHANGDGGVVSCENTVDAVSGLLRGQKIDGYAAVGMNFISAINHLVGGVTVTIEDDFSQYDSTLVQGETITLNDEQAEHFVRGRMAVGDGSNENRMKRQAVYLSALKDVVESKCRSYKAFPLTLYDGLEEYMITNMSRNDFIKLAAALLDAEEQPELEIDGENSLDEWGFNQFTVNEESLDTVVAALFYDKYEGGNTEE